MIGSRLKMHAMESLPTDVVKMLRDHCDLSPATKIILKRDSDISMRPQADVVWHLEQSYIQAVCKTSSMSLTMPKLLGLD